MICRRGSTIASVAAGCVLSLLLLSCSDTEVAAPDTAKKPVEVRVVTTAPSAIARTVEVTGSVVPFRAVQLASPAEGPIISLRVREGDPVRKGDTLLVIGRQEGTDAQIASLREAVHREESNLSRVERLLEIDGNSREQFDQAKAAYESVKAQLVRAQEAARDYSVLAPWDGMTARLFVEVGDFNYISPRKTLIELYDPKSLVIQFSVPEQHAAHLRQQTPVSIALDAYPDTVLQASISRIYPYLDERMRTRTIEVTVSGPANLLPGMFARAKLQVGQIEAAIVVPTQAIVTTPDAASFAYVVHNGKTARRLVQTGIEEAGRVQVVDGLAFGDSVIVTGVMGLSDGRTVRVLEDAPAVSTKQGDAGHQPTALGNAGPLDKPQ